MVDLADNVSNKVGALTHDDLMPRVICGDARNMHQVDNESVDIVVFSTPYNVGIDYGRPDSDNMRPQEYTRLIQDTIHECFRVLTLGGRICVVVATGVGRNPYRPLAAKWAAVVEMRGFDLMGQIVWCKSTTGNRTTWGSWRSPEAPRIRDTSETILIAEKPGPRLHPIPMDNWVVEKGHKVSPLLDAKTFMKLTQDVWFVQPESAQRIGHPAPFPESLVDGLLRLFAWPGAHVLDCFAGSGTTGVVAVNLGMRSTLIEINPDYCKMAEERCRNAWRQMELW